LAQAWALSFIFRRRASQTKTVERGEGRDRLGILFKQRRGLRVELFDPSFCRLRRPSTQLPHIMASRSTTNDAIAFVICEIPARRPDAEDANGVYHAA
jgi:hypothetical protein